jgi:hypothetical protein
MSPKQRRRINAIGHRANRRAHELLVALLAELRSEIGDELAPAERRRLEAGIGCVFARVGLVFAAGLDHEVRDSPAGRVDGWAGMQHALRIHSARLPDRILHGPVEIA